MKKIVLFMALAFLALPAHAQAPSMKGSEVLNPRPGETYVRLTRTTDEQRMAAMDAFWVHELRISKMARYYYEATHKLQNGYTLHFMQLRTDGSCENFEEGDDLYKEIDCRLKVALIDPQGKGQIIDQEMFFDARNFPIFFTKVPGTPFDTFRIGRFILVYSPEQGQYVYSPQTPLPPREKDPFDAYLSSSLTPAKTSFSFREGMKVFFSKLEGLVISSACASIPNSGFTIDTSAENCGFTNSPLEKWTKVSSGFGPRTHPVTGEKGKQHNGIDLAAPTGTPVYAPAGGTVISAGNAGAAGKMVKIRHSDGTITMYMHLSGFGSGIKAGQQVEAGALLGYVGNTGRSTGPHLDYRILKPDGTYVDPGICLGESEIPNKHEIDQNSPLPDGNQGPNYNKIPIDYSQC